MSVSVSSNKNVNGHYIASVTSSNGQVIIIAQSNRVYEVENNIYFPPNSVNKTYLIKANTKSVCQWKGGEAEYYDVNIDNKDIYSSAVWTYPKLLGDKARPIEGYFAFWKGVKVYWQGEDPIPSEVKTIIVPSIPNVALGLGIKNIKSVLWKPSLPLELSKLYEDLSEESFSGYLILDNEKNYNVLVDVLADPVEEQKRNKLINAKRKFGDELNKLNNKGEKKFGYVAVWGSAPPSPQAVDLFNQNPYSIVLLLDDKVEQIA